MRYKMVYLTLLLSLLFLNIHSSILIRHNQLGYFQGGPKNLVIMSDKDQNGNSWNITDSSGKLLLSGTLGNVIKADTVFISTNFNYKIDFSTLNKKGVFNFTLNQNHHCQIKISPNPIKNIISENLKFIKVHRAGISEVEDRKTAHVMDSSCNIMRQKKPGNNKNWYLKNEMEKLNLYGGWYDGFSYIKYTLTNAYTTYLLLSAYEENPMLFSSKKDSAIGILEEAQWGLKYLRKTFTSEDDFIIEVGDFNEDAQGTRLPEMDKMNGKRLGYSALSQSHMGMTVAALSLGSRVFQKRGKTDLAECYKNMALKIYSRLRKLKAETTAWLEHDYALHPDETVYDNLLLASLELYLLTKDQTYLSHSISYSNKAKNKYYSSYTMLHFPAQIKALEFIEQAHKYVKKDLENIEDFSSLKQNIWSVPQEFSYGSIYNSMIIGSAILKYSEISGNHNYNHISSEVYDYLYGKNNWGKSFIVTSKVLNPLNDIRSQIYILQKRKQPLGAVVSGPCDTKSHDEESVWCFFDPKSLPEYPFNTKSVKFFDHSDDLMCNESLVYGVAEAIYFQSLLSKHLTHQETL